METQEELFNQIKDLKFKVDMMAGYVQNDFNDMFEHGVVSIPDLQRGCIDWITGIDKIVTELYDIKAKVLKIMQECIKKYEEK